MYLEKLSPDQSGNGFVTEDAEDRVVYNILSAHGIYGRTADLLKASFNCDIRGHQVRAALVQGSFVFDTEGQRRGIEDALKCASSNATDPLIVNSNLWRAGDLLSFNYLNHTISGEKDKMVEDAQTCYLLTALSLAAWGRNTKLTYAKQINAVPMKEVAKSAASAGNWNELAGVARKFSESPLAKKIHSVVNIKRLNFERDERLKRIMDRLLETYAVVEKPDAVMQAAAQIYEAVYEVNLRELSLAGTSSFV